MWFVINVYERETANLFKNAIAKETANGKNFQNGQQLVKAEESLIFHFLGSAKNDQEKLAISKGTSRLLSGWPTIAFEILRRIADASR